MVDQVVVVCWSFMGGCLPLMSCGRRGGNHATPHPSTPRFAPEQFESLRVPLVRRPPRGEEGNSRPSSNMERRPEQPFSQIGLRLGLRRLDGRSGLANRSSSLLSAPMYFRNQHNMECPICGGRFRTDATDQQVNRHLDGCLVTQELRTIMGTMRDSSSSSTTFSHSWSHRYGHLVDGLIVFDPRRQSSDTSLPELVGNITHDSTLLHLADDNNPTTTLTSPEPPDSAPTQTEALARSLLHVIQGRDREFGGSAEETERQYRHFLRMSQFQYAAITNLSFEEKKKWFYAQLGTLRVNYSQSWVTLNIRRDDFLVSSFNEFRSLQGHDFHKEFQFRFSGEDIQDAGGPSREWFTLISAHLFNPNNGLFCYSDVDNLTYQINPHSGVNDNHLEYFRFAGQAMGKAIFEKQFILCPLARPLLKQLLRRKIDIEDLAFVDQELYNSFEWMKSNSIDNIIFDKFVVEEDRFGEKQNIELKPGGQSIEVSNANKSEYIELRLQYKMRTAIEEQLLALCRGLWLTIPLALLRVFDFQELDLLLNGLPVIDVDDWKLNTAYRSDYNAEHEVVRWFWDTVTESLSQEERARLLQFATGTSRVPAEGFRALESNRGQRAPFTIQPVEYSECHPLPRAHTCFNRLDLPKYTSRGQLETHLLISIHQDITGFGSTE